MAEALLSREYSDEMSLKRVFWGIHALAVGVAGYLLLSGTKEFTLRAVACTATILIYFFRHGITLFYLLQRNVSLEEVTIVSSFLVLWVSVVTISYSQTHPHSQPRFQGLHIFVPVNLQKTSRKMSESSPPFGWLQSVAS